MAGVSFPSIGFISSDLYHAPKTIAVMVNAESVIVIILMMFRMV